MSEDENLLPDVLKRLEIVPSATTLMKATTDERLAMSENPFFYRHETNASVEACDPIKLFGPKCQCSKRLAARIGGSSSSSSSPDNNPSSTSIEHTILNQTQFKRRHISSKFSLRNPILKVIQRCIHYNHVKHKLADGCNLTCSQLGQQCIIDDLNNCPTLETLKIDENDEAELHANADQTNEPKYLDFKELVRECDIISSTSVAGPSQFVGGAIAHRKHAKQFTTIQSLNLRKGKDSKKTKKSQSKLDQEVASGRQDTGSNSSSSSCSQQARINAATTAATSSCDVTIDELASYFETFVHIPKKMSSMAEMMYI